MLSWKPLAQFAAGLVFLATSACALELDLIEATCNVVSEGGYVDPFNRPDLSAISCPAPSGPNELIIVTDENISWPVIVSDTAITSFEEQILEKPDILGEGLFYFNVGEDKVFWTNQLSQHAIISLTGADPVTLDSKRRWIGIDLATRKIVGAADKIEQLDNFFAR